MSDLISFNRGCGQTKNNSLVKLACQVRVALSAIFCSQAGCSWLCFFFVIVCVLLSRTRLRCSLVPSPYFLCALCRGESACVFLRGKNRDWERGYSYSRLQIFSTYNCFAQPFFFSFPVQEIIRCATQAWHGTCPTMPPIKREKVWLARLGPAILFQHNFENNRPL